MFGRLNSKHFAILVFFFLMACQLLPQGSATPLVATEELAQPSMATTPAIRLNDFSPAEITSENAAQVAEIAALELGQAKMISSLAFSPNGEFLAALALDGGLTVWEIRKNQILQQIDNVSNFVFSPNNQQLFTQGTVQENGEYKTRYQLWNTSSWTLDAPDILGVYREVREIAFLPDSSGVLVFLSPSNAITSAGGVTSGYGWYPGDETRGISYFGYYVGLSPERNMLALYDTFDGSISFYDQETDEQFCQYYPHQQDEFAIVGFSANKQLASISLKDSTKLINLGDCKEYLTLTDSNFVSFPVFIGNDQYLAGFNVSTLLVWNLSDGTRSKPIPSILNAQTIINSSYVYSMFTLDGQVVASDGALYRISDGEIINNLDDIAQDVALMQFSADRNWLAVPGKDGNVHLFATPQ